jgi:putative endonuclease
VNPPSWNQFFGRKGERIAKRHLRREGYQILHASYRTPFGEIDLIARRGDVLSFVEVKTRRPGPFGDPLEAITSRKLEHLTKAAECFLLHHPQYRKDYYLLFEAIAVSKDGKKTNVLKVPISIGY